jgi:WD40 repeat protein
LWGDLLISGASDNTLILWDIATAAIIHRFTTPGGANSLAFSPDGLRAVSGAGDAALRLWQTLSLNSLPEWFVANRYVPEWTCEQRERFRVEPLCP